MQNVVMAAIILAFFAYLDQIFVSTMMIGINPPILGGIVAGLVFGDVGLGLYIGTILTQGIHFMSVFGAIILGGFIQNSWGISRSGWSMWER